MCTCVAEWVYVCVMSVKYYKRKYIIIIYCYTHVFSIKKYFRVMCSLISINYYILAKYRNETYVTYIHIRKRWQSSSTTREIPKPHLASVLDNGLNSPIELTLNNIYLLIYNINTIHRWSNKVKVNIIINLLLMKR